jgi:membrane-bound lytic murein transglycosylase D
MNPTSARRTVLWLACAFLSLRMVLAPALASSSSAIPRPPELERDVQFWIRVYTEITTNAGFLHDERNLSVVYETLRFAPDTEPQVRQKQVDARRDRIAAALRRIATSTGPLSAEDQRIRDLWGAEGTPARLLDAANGIRFQLGQADRFREGLIRSGAWETHIAETFANKGLPPELAVLPHVESSFNPSAYSKVGAAGLWQFMRSTGRRYLRIDASVDDRLDPFRSTEAAAQLLAYNYRVLGTWPLALTAYNHGAAGMRRAKEAMGTDDIVKIVRHYKSRTFGFASRNFYVSFLAALEIDRNAEKYFGPIERASEVRYQEVELPFYVPIAALERLTKVQRDVLRSLNPALRPAVWSGQRHVPKGYRLRLPADGERWTPELLAQRLEPQEQLAGQPESGQYRVRPGDTLSQIAQEYRTTVSALAELNGISPKSTLRVGQRLIVPESQPRTVVASAPTAPKAPKTAPSSPAEPGSVYIVRRGDALSEIAKKTGVSEAQLLKLNKIRNPNFIFEGQQLLLAAPAEPASTDASVRVAKAETVETGGVPAAVAQRESAEDEAAVAANARPVERAEPVSAAQAEALSPALGPAIETPQTADATDYSVASDNTIVVAAAETLGHYAEWLGIRAARLREINNMAYGKPVVMGRRLKLEFTRTTPQEFEERRREYHRTIQASYFASNRIVGTEVYIARRGDSLWSVTQRYAGLPVWLLQQYNPDVDLSEMRAGTAIVVPRVEQVEVSGG